MKHEGVDTKKSYYVPALDGLRFFAFLVVLHRPMPIIEHPVIMAAYQRIHISGWVGVDLFFCISAFLITELLLREYNKTQTIDIAHFYIRRVLRIWPLYFLILFLVFVAFPLFGVSFSPAWGSDVFQTLKTNYLPLYGILFGNIAIMIKGFPEFGMLSILWTLAIEEQFYLIWPFLIFFLIQKKRSLQYAVLLLFFFLPLYMRWVFYLWEMPWYFVYVNPLSRFDAFAAGALASFVSRDLIAYGVSRKWIAAVSGSIAVLIGWGLFQADGFTQINNSIDMVWMYSVLAIGMAAVLLYVLHSRWLIHQFLALPFIAWLGKISYGLYIYQLLAIFIVEKYFHPQGTLSEWLVFIVFTLIMSVVLASVSYYGFERYFLVLKKRFTTIESRKA
jgi:peptidoglycan/LPS O-acetylase OafA/YrhL